MANSPAKRHFQRVTAAQAAAAAAGPVQTMEGLTAYELQLAQLIQDRARLKGIQSTEGKVELKRQLLPAYAPYIEGVLSAGQGAQDEVLVTVMLWRIDTGDYAGGLEIAAYVFQHELVMPDRFNRTVGCLVAEEVAEGAMKTLKTEQPFDIDVLKRTAELTAEQDMPDEVRAKLNLALGRALVFGVTPEAQDVLGKVTAGIVLLRRAIELHDKCGGKKDLEAAERLRKQIEGAGPASPEAPPSPQDTT
ncbi:terminase endonuclease subunit [Pseudomonas citronellolis]|uniref:phage terminase small subunit n=1 Tax=Pseudomonas citronellolis TaxID=53408 RepID=UPI0023E3C31E|nr:terminase endonuclease subunit [Pseudomonas citronellolis]MDF3935365.1 terminase endonuclease subunit [Pseudomonas citronellolis]